MGQNNKKRQEEEAFKSMAALLHDYEMSRIPPKEELEERYQLSDIFYQKMDRMIEKQEKKVRWKQVRRAVSAAAAVAALLVGISNPQIIAQASDWIIGWFGDHVSYQFKEDTDVNWVPRYELGYVPEGYELTLDDYSDPGGYIAYYNEQGYRLDLDYGVIDGSLEVDNENKDFLILIGNHGEKIYYLRATNSQDDSSMTWVSEDGTTKFNLMGNLPEAELLKIQEGIRIVDEDKKGN